MAEFRFSLSPPRKGTQAAGLSPRSCLKAKETLTRLQSFGVPVRMSDQDLLTLDPRPEDADVDILSYHDRVSSVLPSDRTKVVVLLPAQSKMDTMSQKFANLEGIVTDLVGKVAELQEGRKREDRVRFQAYQANLVTEFVRKLAKQLKTTIPQGRSKADFDQSRFLAAASSTLKTITAQDFKKKTGLDPSYRETFEDYEKILAARCSWAHESQNEFARLLLSDQFRENAQKFNVGHWEKLLLWVYEKDSLEEMAAVVANI